MKRKITITTPDGKSISKTETIRNLEHFEIQKNNRAHVMISKKTYNRARDKKVRSFEE